MLSRAVAWSLGLALLLGGCQGSRESQLRKRAKEFYDLKVEGNWKDMYAYLDANTRRRMPRFNYVMMQTVADYLSYEISAVQIEEDVAKVKLGWKYKLIHPAALQVDEGKFAEEVRGYDQEDEWVLEDGVWNYVLKPALSPAQRAKQGEQVPVASRDFFEFLQSIQDLPPDERKRKVEEWRSQHPNLMTSAPPAGAPPTQP